MNFKDSSYLHLHACIHIQAIFIILEIWVIYNSWHLNVAISVMIAQGQGVQWLDCRLKYASMTHIFFVLILSLFIGLVPGFRWFRPLIIFECSVMGEWQQQPSTVWWAIEFSSSVPQKKSCPWMAPCSSVNTIGGFKLKRENQNHYVIILYQFIA